MRPVCKSSNSSEVFPDSRCIEEGLGDAKIRRVKCVLPLCKEARPSVNGTRYVAHGETTVKANVFLYIFK